jgi:hypothetical protein
MSDDALGPLTTYGQHLLHLGESQELLILNKLLGFPNSRFFMCWPHGGGASVVDYVISSHNLLPFIHHFFVPPFPSQTMLFSPSLSELTLPLPPHPLPRAHPTLFFNLTRGTRMPFLPTSNRCYHLRPNSPYLISAST